jgi:hypothetical protein
MIIASAEDSGSAPRPKPWLTGARGGAVIPRRGIAPTTPATEGPI